jgi:hypothetical protein
LKITLFKNKTKGCKIIGSLVEFICLEFDSLVYLRKEKPNLGLSTKLSNHPDAAVMQQVGEIEETFQNNLSKESSGADDVDIDPTFIKPSKSRVRSLPLPSPSSGPVSAKMQTTGLTVHLKLICFSLLNVLHIRNSWMFGSWIKLTNLFPKKEEKRE